MRKGQEVGEGVRDGYERMWMDLQVWGGEGRSEGAMLREDGRGNEVSKGGKGTKASRDFQRQRGTGKGEKTTGVGGRTCVWGRWGGEDYEAENQTARMKALFCAEEMEERR